MSCSIRYSLVFAFTSTPVLIFFSSSIIHKKFQYFYLFSYSGTPFNTDWRLGCTFQILFHIYCSCFLSFSLLCPCILSALTLVFSSSWWTWLTFHPNISACCPIQTLSLDSPYLLLHTCHLLRYQYFFPHNPLVSL